MSAERIWSRTEYQFDRDHPTADGHFPSNPIIPGALLLDHVLRAVGSAAPMTLRFVKFHQVVRPGDRIEIRWHRSADRQVAFECWLQGPGKIALSGALTPTDR
jgi:3-hydroxymyristoyl/3-hydroxydecanoyl-(acyl carrier protein) dehydratase